MHTLNVRIRFKESVLNDVARHTTGTILSSRLRNYSVCNFQPLSLLVPDNPFFSSFDSINGTGREKINMATSTFLTNEEVIVLENDDDDEYEYEYEEVLEKSQGSLDKSDGSLYSYYSLNGLSTIAEERTQDLRDEMTSHRRERRLSVSERRSQRRSRSLSPTYEPPSEISWGSTSNTFHSKDAELEASIRSEITASTLDASSNLKGGFSVATAEDSEILQSYDDFTILSGITEDASINTLSFHMHSFVFDEHDRENSMVRSSLLEKNSSISSKSFGSLVPIDEEEIKEAVSSRSSRQRRKAFETRKTQIGKLLAKQRALGLKSTPSDIDKRNKKLARLGGLVRSDSFKETKRDFEDLYKREIELVTSPKSIPATTDSKLSQEEKNQIIFQMSMSDSFLDVNPSDLLDDLKFEVNARKLKFKQDKFGGLRRKTSFIRSQKALSRKLVALQLSPRPTQRKKPIVTAPAMESTASTAPAIESIASPRQIRKGHAKRTKTSSWSQNLTRSRRVSQQRGKPRHKAASHSQDRT